MKILPFFVYGTLLPGQPNYHLWGEMIAWQRAAQLAQGQLFDMGHYPMLLEGQGGPVAGVVIAVQPRFYEEVLTRLDALERFDPEDVANSVYQRVVRQVLLADGERLAAWVYVGQERYVAGLPPIEGGSWTAHVVALQADIDRWWSEERPLLPNDDH